jgi:iron(III) transport system substrate-binding protein
MNRPLVLTILAVLLVAGLGLAVLRWWQRLEPTVVLYCAQDQEFAEDLLEDFHKRSGLPVSTKYDTEADKSVSLYVALLREKDRPRCDVFWNNEILSTIRLQRAGLLEPYDSPPARALQPFPPSAVTADHAWHAFACRPRILIVNTERIKEEKDRPKSLLDLAKPDPRWKGQVCMAKPQFGTSATQAACLFEVLGPREAREYYRGLHRNMPQPAPGNKQVAEWVADGRTPGGQPLAVGVTDPDDALDEVRKKKPVAIVFPDRDAEGLGTLFIPNTVAVLKGCPNPDGARKLVDFLLGEEVEGRLAESDSHQVPFNPAARGRLPPEMKEALTAKVMQVDFGRAADLWDEAQAFLVEEFAR